jgi:hypothetical protein
VPRLPLPRAVRRAVPLALALLTALSVAAPPATAAVQPAPRQPTPQAPVDLPAGLEALPGYAPATSCDPTAKPGVLRFAALVQATYPGTGSSGIVRDCNRATSLSEHTEGRAWDWRVSTTDAAQVAQVRAFHEWLLAPDGDEPAANARRLGVMYMIWDRQILSVARAAGGWRPYACSGVTGCHQDHVHYSFTWAGAQARTSFWSGSVAPVDHGPCRAAGRMFSAPYDGRNADRCAPWRPLAADDALVADIRRWQGERLEVGASGSAVTTLQRALGGGASGQYDAGTRGRVHLFQARRRLPRTGVVDRATWASLLSYVTGGAAVLAPATAPAAPAAPRLSAPAARPAARPVWPVRVSAALARPAVRLGGSTVLTVTAPASARGRLAFRQQFVLGRWVTLDRRVVRATGSARFLVRPTTRGVKAYRVVLRGAPAVASPTVRLTVR